jgi:LmbE family N-acetylglucosaminyl deacetylase
VNCQVNQILPAIFPGIRSEFVIEADNQHHPRIVLVAAHPEDETIGAGALMSRNNNVKILHVTDGARSECRMRWRPVSRAERRMHRRELRRLGLLLH